ncbi:MAG: neutral/alkaline non-lysosomal ceramidase N-terminal domain-containing protein [Planctomycetales bacterium]|nr:neutral/alkaline non-lysosomal ceramidase N-terminal domain-containing protein [Planctomycetales bacterium]
MFRVFVFVCCLLFGGAFVVTDQSRAAEETPMQFGFAKVDVTPTEPIRLSGYGDRKTAFEGVDERLYARVMALRYGDGKVHLLVAVDTIGFPGYLTKQIHAELELQHGIDRAQFALCGTHSHTAPHLDLLNMINLYEFPLKEEEIAATKRYGEAISAHIIQACADAITDLKPGRMFTAEGKASFAVNRRTIDENGNYLSMRPNPGGSVDHSVPILKITDPTGEVVRGVVFNYACHCTTFTGQHNRINGDWAGYAAKNVEAASPDVVALCTIGCGADANPTRATGRDLEMAQHQGKELSDEVLRLAQGPMTEITAKVQSNFSYAGLPLDRSPLGKYKEDLNSRQAQVRVYGQRMLDVFERMGRLPESYPMPIQVWRFGDQLTMVMLGGEVCSEYSLRAKRELTQGAVWVTAYANDVFGYVVPESMRSEGGYEVDFSMVFYNKPGRWSSGAEEIIFRELHQLVNDSVPGSPLSPEDGLGSITVPAGYAVELVAAEPLIADPVNFAVGADGRLWVVEMADYPRGANDDGMPGGRVKVLSDTNGDGRYDEAVLFLDALHYPTGVMPWRKGALVSCVPDVFYAQDTDGDGRADLREVLYTNFSEANPQHQMSGFTRGLDNWLYLACGDDNGKVLCVKTGEEVSVSGRDARIFPDKGYLESVSGRSQYGRCHNDWGHWFGNTNGEPLLHFVVDDRYLGRNPYVPAPSPKVATTDPPVAPPVFPTSRTVNRFNDLFDANRFTSACSPLIFRDSTLGEDVQGAAFICEPVHNLVSRLMLSPNGVTYQATRHRDEQSSEFFSSTDPWCRPVRTATGPDGALWVADMYRQVIEHPEWIPEDWQVKLDLYAGRRQGRIYRVFRRDQPPGAIPDLTKLDSAALVQQLGADNGWRRDTAQELLVQRNDLTIAPELLSLIADDSRPLGRLHALATLDGLGQLNEEALRVALADSNPYVVARAISLAEPSLSSSPELTERLIALADHSDPHVRLQVALSLGELDDASAGSVLLKLALQDTGDSWLRAAVICSSHRFAAEMLAAMLAAPDSINGHEQLLQDLIATSLGGDVAGGAARVINLVLQQSGVAEARDWQFRALASCFSALRRRNQSWESIAQGNPALAENALPFFDAARDAVGDTAAALEQRLATIQLLGNEAAASTEDLELLSELLSPREPVELQRSAVQVMARIRPGDLVDRLLGGWTSHGPQLQAEILATLLSRSEWVEALLKALADGTLPVKDLDPSSRWRLLGYPVPRVRAAALEIFGDGSASSRAQVLVDYEAAASLEGDVANGARQFTKTCAVCHRHGTIGTEVGPNLAALKDKSSAFLMTAILDPNRAVDGKYHNYTVLTADGLQQSGLIAAETANSIELVDAQGKKHTILRIDIDELASSGVSFMPEGLEKELAPQDLADIMEFIRSDPEPN